jgi:hypothetical protein
MRRLRIPQTAVLLFAGVALGVVLLTVALLLRTGQLGLFFERGDARMYWLTARDLFGAGDGFAALGRASEVPYRYGRVGMPFAGWVLAFGQPQLVGSGLIAVNVLALAAVAGLSAVLIAEYGGHPATAVWVLLVPGLLPLTMNVVAEPLLVALILLAYVLDRRGRRAPARWVMAYAILVKEVAVLALVPWTWRAIRERDRSALRGIAATLLPYATWCVWVRVRVGEFPFLARTANRSDALALPFAGIRAVVSARTPDYQAIVAMLLVTIVLGVAAAWIARGTQLAGLVAAFALPAVCLGVQALRFEGEAMRLLVVPQVFAVVAIAAMCSGRNRFERRAATRQDVPDARALA